jgi:TPR repeat protein
MREAIVGAALAVLFALTASEVVAQTPNSPTDAELNQQIDDLLPKAKGGDPKAEYDLGFLYRELAANGQLNYLSEARKWSMKAAEAGLPEAEYAVGVDSYTRFTDPVEARVWIKKAADQGNLDAQADIGSFISEATTERSLARVGCYGNPRVCDVQHSAALKSYEDLARSGQLEGAYNIAFQHISDEKAQRGKERLETILYEVAGVTIPLLVVLLIYAPSLMRMVKRRAERRARTKFNSTPIGAAALRRWPEDRFPRINEPLTEETLIGWGRMLEKWPNPPLTDNERRGNEQKFWRYWAGQYTQHSNSAAQLAPKQKIIDDFAEAERWWLREYYAATGIYNEPHAGPEYVRLDQKYSHALTWAKKFSKTKPNMTTRWGQKKEAEHDLKAASEKLEEYAINGKKAHTEKWGGWFFMNIEQAFKEANAGPVDEDVGSQKVHGDARLATEAEAIAAAGDGGNRKSSVHDREF